MNSLDALILMREGRAIEIWSGKGAGVAFATWYEKYYRNPRYEGPVSVWYPNVVWDKYEKKFRPWKHWDYREYPYEIRSESISEWLSRTAKDFELKPI